MTIDTRILDAVRDRAKANPHAPHLHTDACNARQVLAFTQVGRPAPGCTCDGRVFPFDLLAVPCSSTSDT